ncbi:MAG TPA: class I SAM-dependent methyltransferase [Alphaproteobacteria bacterium]|jgi:predicted O-methyltransferase YrrM|nr:class I SAM-dependent methyltransferase [Alphaproteobacteria bacterium]
MPGHRLKLTNALYDYIDEVSVRDTEVQRRLRAETLKMRGAQMQISPEQGQFMQLLIELIGAKRTLEIGTYTGYSALAVALALPPEGQIVACDVSEEWTAVARRYWHEAAVDHKIDLRLQPAIETLDRLIAAGESGKFDFAFIDADKENYDAYYERALQLVRAGGLIAIDNVLWGGAVIDTADHTKDTRAIRALNKKLKDDQRITISMTPIGDGLTLARKR